MAKAVNVSLRTRWLGEMLRQARKRTECTLREAADYVGIDLSSLGRFERGTHRIRKSYLRDLVNLYGISDPNTRDMLLRINEDSWKRDWWDDDTDDLEMAFLDYTWLEARAEHIYSFEPLIIPGLLQTKEYATAVASHGPEKPSTTEVDKLVQLRVDRQETLWSSNPTGFTAILEEPALRRPVGGWAVHREQLRHLLTLTKTRHVNVRVLPMWTDWDPGYVGAFTIFGMPEPFSDVALTDGVVGRTFFEAQEKVEQFRRTYDELDRLALGPRKSTAHIHSILEET